MRRIGKNKEDQSYFPFLLQADNTQWSPVHIGLIKAYYKEKVLSELFSNQKKMDIIFGQVQVGLSAYF